MGPATEARLAKIGVTTIGQLAESAPQSVERLLGHAAGQKLTATLHHLADRIGARLRAKSSCNSSCRSALETKDDVLAQRRAWRDRAQTGPSIRSVSASADERWIMGRRRGFGPPSLTSSDALQKESFDYRLTSCQEAERHLIDAVMAVFRPLANVSWSFARSRNVKTGAASEAVAEAVFLVPRAGIEPTRRLRGPGF